MSLFSAVEMAPRDPILGLNEAFNADTRTSKVNLGVGVYCNEEGRIPLLRAVVEAETIRVAQHASRGYLPIDGIAAYDQAVQKLLFGAESPLLAAGRVITTQAVGGTGALKIGADFLKQLQKLAAGSVAFATIPVLAEDGWSDDGMQSVVAVDPTQVQEWVGSLLHDQAEGKTAAVVYSPEQTTAEVVNDSDINGLAGAVSDRLGAKGFTIGEVGNNEKAKVTQSQVQAATEDDLGAQAVAKELGGLPVVADPAIPAGTVRVVLSEDYDGPGSGLDGTLPTGDVSTAETVDKSSGAADTGTGAPPPSPVITAGSDDPRCVY